MTEQKYIVTKKVGGKILDRTISSKCAKLVGRQKCVAMSMGPLLRPGPGFSFYMDH